MALPKFQALGMTVSPRDFGLLQTTWAALIDPIIGRKQNQSNILDGEILINGTTVVNHKLGKKLSGYKIILQNAKASIYDTQSTNQSPELTLVLVSDAAVTVSIEVF